MQSLYLDTARIGQMSPTAQRMYHDTIELAGEEGGSSTFDLYFRQGFEALPPRLKSRFPALRVWQGIRGLKRRLANLLGLRDGNTLIAGRSQQMMRLGARLLFTRCRHVLTTDLEWPPYVELLRRQQKRSGARLTVLPLAAQVLREGQSGQFVARTLAETYQTSGCDGLFLSATTSSGIRLCTQEILSAIRKRSSVRFSVVDGAQGFCHTPFSVADAACDFYIGGAHKWLRAWHPMGFGFCGRPETKSFIAATLAEMIRDGELDDPLLNLTHEVLDGISKPIGETVNLGPLFSCQGALEDVPDCQSDMERKLAVAARIRESATGTRWRVLTPAPEFRSGAVLFESQSPGVCSLEPAELAGAFRERGLSLSAYASGRIRVSVPFVDWTQADSVRLKSALSAIE